MRRALILGGTGAIGRATALRLLAAGWRVDLTGRNPARMPAEVTAAGGSFIGADRRDLAALAAAYGAGADLVVDCVCYTAADAAALLPLARDAGGTVMISTKAVYADADGNHSNSDIPPRFERPITEDNPTVAPDAGPDYNSRHGYGACKAAAEQVLLESGAPVAILRPSKIHGAGSRQPREWVFVRRVLDRRTAVFLARRGAGVDHPTAAANIASLIEVAAARPGPRVLNIADPDAPSGLEISRVIAGLMGHAWEEVLLGEGEEPGLGRHPWDAAHPIVLDLNAAARLGYVPAGDYAATVPQEVDWLVRLAGTSPDALGETVDNDTFSSMLDYRAEDRYLSRRAAVRHGGEDLG